MTRDECDTLQASNESMLVDYKENYEKLYPGEQEVTFL